MDTPRPFQRKPWVDPRHELPALREALTKAREHETSNKAEWSQDQLWSDEVRSMSAEGFAAVWNEFSDDIDTPRTEDEERSFRRKCWPLCVRWGDENFWPRRARIEDRWVRWWSHRRKGSKILDRSSRSTRYDALCDLSGFLGKRKPPLFNRYGDYRLQSGYVSGSTAVYELERRVHDLENPASVERMRLDHEEEQDRAEAAWPEQERKRIEAEERKRIDSEKIAKRWAKEVLAAVEGRDLKQERSDKRKANKADREQAVKEAATAVLNQRNAAIAADFKAGMRNKDLVEKYGLSKGQISTILKNHQSTN